MKTYALFNYPPRHEYVLGEEVYLHVFLTSSLDGGMWSALYIGRFTPGERAPVPIG